MSVVENTIETKIPARLDRLPWTRWHWYVVAALGTVWVLDGLEVTIKGAVGAQLQTTLGFSTVQVAGSASAYIFGAISGALFWGYLTDRFGRRKLFFVTMATYLAGVSATALTGTWFSGSKYEWFAAARVLTGLGIGGEYAAINSAVDELIPARVRGWVDLAINGSWWIGTAFGAAIGYLFLVELPAFWGWRAAFSLGGTIAVGILLMRIWVPESPRWLVTHGQEDEAERVVSDIEEDVAGYADEELETPSDEDAIELRQRRSIGFLTIARTIVKEYPKRGAVGFSLMTAQAFLYNGIFFTFGLMITTFFGVKPTHVGLFLVPFAAGNYLGPLTLGRLFDRIGRRPMIIGTFVVSGALTIIVGYLFAIGTIDSSLWATVAWVVIFFFASAGSSAGYLTVSETFPLEIRAMAIAFFYAVGTGLGGIVGPLVFGSMISTAHRFSVFYAYVIGGGLMLAAAMVEQAWGVAAEGRSLEDVAQPITAEEAERGTEGEGDGSRTRDRVQSRKDAQPPFRRRHLFSGLPTPIAYPPADRDVVREIDVLEQALREDGPASRQELRRRVRARYWGPGRFGGALRAAMSRGRIRRIGGQRYEVAI
jgi:MFS family permease